MSRALKPQDHFTYGDYCHWPEEQRWELIHGVAYAMTTPLRIHQKVVGELAWQIKNHLQGKPCEPYIAPFDVRLPNADEADEQIDTVVQPDIAVICDLDKLDAKGCRGAPDWIIEVLSPSTSFKDMEIKRKLYQQHGVREYWLIHPTEYWGMAYRLSAAGSYALPSIFKLQATTAVESLPGLHIEWAFMAAEMSPSKPSPALSQ